MFLASVNDKKYPRYPLALKFNATLARPLRLVILYIFKCQLLSDDWHLYIHDSKNKTWDMMWMGSQMQNNC